MSRLNDSLRSALQSLLRDSSFSAMVVLTLALGIGASAGIFSVFHQILLDPLPVEDPHQLVNLSTPGPRQGSTSCGIEGPCEMVFSHPLFRDLESAQQVFDGLAAHVEIGLNVAFDDRTAALDGLLVSGGYFSTLGLAPAHGRLIDTQDDAEIGQHRVAVLSYRYWQRELGADPSVVGSTIRVNGRDLSVIGVAPPGFAGTTRGREADVFVPLSLRWLLLANFPHDHEDRMHHFLYLFARLQPGVTNEQASVGINPLFQAILRDVEAPLQTVLSEAERALFPNRELLLLPGARGQSEVILSARVPLIIMLGATLVLLLIACANVANLMMARVMQRSGEFAVRAALGAGRAQGIVRLLIEAALLATAGGLLGLLVAAGLMQFIGRILLDTAEVAGIQPELNASVVAFAALLSLVSATLCSGYPAWRASRIQPAAAMSEASGRSGGGRRAARLRYALMTAQISLSLALLVTAGLFAHSLWNITRADSGLETDGVLSFAVSPGRNGYTPQAAAELFANLEERLAALPAVESASAAVMPLLTGFGWQANVRIVDEASGSAIERNVHHNRVGADFFTTLGLPVRAGRVFTDADRADAMRVAVVNEAFVRRLELESGALGRIIDPDGRRNRALDIEIVGIVGDSRPRSLSGGIEPQVFYPWTQFGQPTRMHFYLRTAGDPRQLGSAVRAAVAELDPHLPIEQMDTLNGVIRATLVLDRSVGLLAGLVAAMALVLVAVGLYGVLSYTLAQRTREIGLRAALGANAIRVQRMIAAQVMWMAGIGSVLGLAAAWALARTMDALLFELHGLDWATAIISLTLVTLIVLAASWRPMRRAASIQPMEALRQE